MKRRYKWIVSLITASGAIFFCGVLAFKCMVTASAPRPHSDIPISSELGSWPYQDGLVVTRLFAEAVNPKLNLFNGQFLIRYHLTGSVTNSHGWRPKVASAQITARMVSRGIDAKPSVADILIVPIIDVTEDAHYSQEQVPFDIKLEQIIQTMDWVENQYEIYCLNQTASLSVLQIK